MDAIANLQFLRPYWFFGLPIVAFVLLLLYRRGLTSRSWINVCDANLLPFLIDNMVNNKRRLWPYIVAALLGVLVIIALAGPVWKKLPQPLYRDDTALILLLDLSRSMDATDLAPSRLVRARYKVLDILKKRRRGVTALIVYSQDAFVVSPLTEDNKTIANMVNSLSTDLMPSKGSNPAMALNVSMDLLKQSGIRSGDLLLITDGIPTKAIQGIKKLAEGGHRVSVLAVGTEQGAPIKLSNGAYIKDSRGNVVIPKLEYDTLVKAVHQGGGRISRISAGDEDIDYLLAGVNKAFEFDLSDRVKRRTELNSDIWREEGPWLLLLIAPFIALYFRKGLLVITVCCVLPMGNDAYAFEWASLWKTHDQRAAQAYAQETYKDAAQLFTNPEWRAAAQYKDKNYEAVLQSLQGKETADALYNQANALAKLGRFEEAIATYDKVLDKQSDHEDASYNRQLLLDNMQQQQEQQQGQGDDQNNDGSKQDQSQNQQGDSGKESGQQRDADNQQGDSTQSSAQKKSDQAAAEQAKQQQQQAETPEENSTESADHQQQARIADEQDSDKENQSELSDSEKREALAREQWLRRIPDDPGGLLRRKFQYQWQRRGTTNTQEGNPW